MKKTIVSFITMAVFLLVFTISVSAATYSTTYKKAVSNEGGSGIAYCNATYDTTGNTRWKTNWYATYGSDSKAAYASEESSVVKGTRLDVVGKIRLTDYSYHSGTSRVPVIFTYSSGKVTAKAG